MATQTPVLDLTKPTVNGPETENDWGLDLNENFDKIDAWALITNNVLKDGDKGDIVVSSSGAGWNFDPTVVTDAARTLLDDTTTVAMRTTLGAAAVVHTHTIADVTGLQAALDAKAALVHTHAIADVTGLQSALNSKAAVAHTHAIADVTGLQPALDVKAPLASPVFTGNPTAPTPTLGDNDTSIATTAFVAATLSAAQGGTVLEAPNDGQTYARRSLAWAPIDTTPAWGELIGVPATFPPSPHTHPWSDLTAVPATFPPSAHIHPQSDVTNLVSDLAAKAPLASPLFTGDPRGPTPTAGDNDTSLATTAFVTAALAAARIAHGQVRLGVFSATSLKLLPYDGNRLIVGNTVRTVPNAGISAGLTGVLVNGVTGNLAASTTYLVSVYDNAGTLTLAFWPVATGHSLDATSAVEIITGQAGHTLVGLIRTTATPQFADTATVRGSANWFNRRNTGFQGAHTNAAGTASLTLVEIATLARIGMCCWAGETINLGLAGSGANNGTGIQTRANIRNITATTDLCPSDSILMSPTANAFFPMANNAILIPAADGYFEFSPSGCVGAASTASYYLALAGGVRQ